MIYRLQTQAMRPGGSTTAEKTDGCGSVVPFQAGLLEAPQVTPGIRPARPNDAATIVDFNQRLAQESESKTLREQVLRAGVEQVLADPSRGSYFLAELGGQTVGQLMITYEWSDWRNGLFWWIQSVYVIPAARRTGIFSALYKHVAQLAEEDPAVCGIRLYVDQDNTRAQETYRAMGLSLTGYQVMELEL